MFITFEGGEGTGKSTQALILADILKKYNIDVVLTREPGGSPGAEIIRNLLVTGSVDRWSNMSEVLLMYAARSDHWQNTIKPALDNGSWVLCDRFADSTIAYQGYGRGVNQDFLKLLYNYVIGDIEPDLTFVFDLDVEEGIKRATARMEGNVVVEGRFEAMDLSFHKRIRSGFLEIAKNNKRCVLINADAHPKVIHRQIMDELQERKVLPWKNLPA
ncbi:MAG: dTMP kinase [Pseudomonadota bacterium]|jgi:dTMP kinase|nr:dTMP kinase [Alphaproteobacteria bacterium]